MLGVHLVQVHLFKQPYLRSFCFVTSIRLIQGALSHTIKELSYTLHKKLEDNIAQRLMPNLSTSDTACLINATTYSWEIRALYNIPMRSQGWLSCCVRRQIDITAGIHQDAQYSAEDPRCHDSEQQPPA